MSGVSWTDPMVEEADLMFLEEKDRVKAPSSGSSYIQGILRSKSFSRRIRKLTCVFHIKVVTIQGLPSSMDRRYLSVCVRKEGMKPGAVQTKQTQFVAHPLQVVVHAYPHKLQIGKHNVELAHLVQDCIAKSLGGTLQ
ncbi:hypothetical protein IFM89_023349 [Coptis chinensis]|uniref:Uncharacterized protein n=1 Tax=Coptis chinensis TaxID=261450 RepID=A0A835HPH7_9MAGN|nr:hypothetical protein IFM89_023349 [Coptis chinensis]